MRQQVLAYQETCIETPITHTVAHKTASRKLSAIGKQRISALILLVISIVLPILTTDLTASLFLLPLSISLLFSKKIHIN